MTILYVIAACILTPYLMEWVNRKRLETESGHRLSTVVNKIKGWPAYAITVVVCCVVGLAVCLLPFGPGASLTNWFLVTAVVFFGNQFVFQTFIKLLAKYRRD